MTDNVHPYQPPNAEPKTDKRDGRIRISQTMWLIAFLYPLILMGSLYGTWLAAWWQLGHMPRPNVDDPKSVGGILSVGWMVPLLFLMLLPIMLPLGFVASFYLRLSRTQPRVEYWWWVLPAIYILFCLLDYWMLKWDPCNVAEWYSD